MRILKSKNRKYEEERGYGESSRKIINGWLLKLKNESIEGCLKKQK